MNRLAGSNGHVRIFLSAKYCACYLMFVIRCYKSLDSNLHTYIFNNPRSRETIQDTKTVSDKIETDIFGNVYVRSKFVEQSCPHYNY